METRRTKAEQSQITTSHLIEVGRILFTRDGYTNTATEDIVQQAGVTRGALYHHFESKEGLFKAVLLKIQQEVGAKVELAAAQTADRWLQLKLGCQAFLEASLDPQVRQIMLIDAPSVVGWDTWRQQDAENSMAGLQSLLQDLFEQGVLIPQPMEALTHLLSGAMNEGALWIAKSKDPDKALTDALSVLNHLLESLRANYSTSKPD